MSAILCVVLGVLCLGVACVAMYYDEARLSAARLVLFCVAPGLLGASLVASVWASTQLRHTALIVMLSAIAATYSAEVFLAFNPEYAALKGVNTGEPAPPAAHDSVAATAQLPLICTGLAPSAGFPTERGALLPLGGVSGNLLGVSRRAPEGRLSDQFGFNNPPDQWDTRRTAAMIVGDSFTFGAGAPIGEGFSDYLRDAFGVLVNLGCAGNGPLSELGALAEYGPRLRPRYVIWAYYEENDLSKDIVRERASPILRAYVDGGSQGLIERQDEIDRVLRDYISAQEGTAGAATPPRAAPAKVRSIDVLMLRNLRTAFGLSNGYRPESLALFERVIARADALVQSWNGKLIFVYLPGPTRYTGRVAALDADGLRRRIFERIASPSIATIDVAASFAHEREPLVLFYGHYTAAGYRLVADTIINELGALNFSDIGQ